MDARTSAIFLFSTGNTLFRQISSKKNQNGKFKLKFGTQTNLNMQNSMMMFNFSVFDWKYTFWANLVQKIEIVSFFSIWVFFHKLLRITSTRFTDT